MRRSFIKAAGIGLALVLASSAMPAASAASLPLCSQGKSVKVVKGKATMLFKGKRVACKFAKPAPKPSTPVPSAVPQVRFAGNVMNDLVIRANLTITIRNTDAVAHTLVIASEGISILVSPNDISAFISPSKPGTYTMTTAENPNIKATLTVLP